MTSDLVESVYAQLTADDVAALTDPLVAPGYRESKRVLLAVGAWLRGLVRIESELSWPVEHPSAWGVHDFLQMLIFRDWVEKGLPLVEPVQRARVAAAVARVDEWFRTWTEFDPGRMATVDGGGYLKYGDFSGWWWQRVPDRGPIHEELLEFGHDHRGDGSIVSPGDDRQPQPPAISP